MKKRSPFPLRRYFAILGMVSSVAFVAHGRPVVIGFPESVSAGETFDVVRLKSGRGAANNTGVLVSGNYAVPPSASTFPEPFIVFVGSSSVVVPVTRPSYCHKLVSAFFSAEAFSAIRLVPERRAALFTFFINISAALVGWGSANICPPDSFNHMRGFWASAPGCCASALDKPLVRLESVFGHIFSDCSSAASNDFPDFIGRFSLAEIPLGNLLFCRLREHAGQYA